MTVTTAPDIIIGGPICRREWIIDDWYRHALVAVEQAGLDHRFLHVLPTWDPTNDHLDPEAIVVHTDEEPRQDRRTWNHARYRQMVDLRNQGLAAVRDHEPRWFLSLDSDIYLHPQAIVSLLDALENPTQERLRFGAVGGKTYMGDTRRYPSYGMFKTKTGGIRRTDVDYGLFPVDAIMAIKMMTPAAYAVDYQYHPHGEDLGWSQACRAAGVKLGWDGRVESKHIYTRPK